MIHVQTYELGDAGQLIETIGYTSAHVGTTDEVERLVRHEFETFAAVVRIVVSRQTPGEARDRYAVTHVLVDVERRSYAGYAWLHFRTMPPEMRSR